ncbi:putative type II secretion system protein HxcR [Pontiella sulfatireligans]|uniref:Putative type II secretion system protein HxcR n=1 Tax=Pontiella sulfatireligans TaxID=2750658 RepID=A0A6C2UIS1_9BACT|nr:GspE/PulE family protein [Pontiella sulfatireligans]VGO20008.1 putative type II secretion system protein HxcR [Pontiella sulfatireligans]
MNNQLIADMLRQAEQLDPAAAADALAAATQRRAGLLDVLAERGHDKQKLFNELTRQCGMEPIELSSSQPTPAAATLMPAETARRYRVVPVHKTDGVLTAAIGNPFDIDTLDTLRYVLTDSVEILAALPEQIEEALARLYPESSPVLDIEEPPLEKKDTASEADEPIIRLVNQLIVEGFRARASDIHLEPLNRQFRVRCRIDGALREVEGPPRRLHPSVISRIKIMANMKISEKRLPQDGRIEIRVMGRALDLRVSSIPTNHGESIVMRILDKQSLTLGLPNLGFHPDDQQTFERLIRCPDGILLVTGPTGSGKTTSLYACLNHLNQPDRKIITVEDPVEYQLSGINQVHVRADIGLTFSAALRSILRQAPNIIMIGEIRDRETAEIAINAALTGHLVLSTLHTNDAPSAITRLADIGVKPFLVSSSVRGIMAQRLVRTVCEKCKTAYTPTEAESRLLASAAQLYRGTGCPACGDTGYAGRKGIFELLAINDDVRQMIYSGAPVAELRAKARSMGMRTLREDGLRKAADGITTVQEVLRVTMRDEN